MGFTMYIYEIRVAQMVMELAVVWWRNEMWKEVGKW